MAAVAVVGTRVVEFRHQAFDLPQVALFGGNPFGQAETQFAVFDFGEFDAAHAQADSPVMPRDALHAGERRDMAPGFQPVGSRPAAGLQAGVQIAAVGRVDARDEAFLGVAEQFVAGGARG